MSCKFCDLGRADGKAYDIALYELSSLGEGIKYILDITYPCPFDEKDYSELLKVKALEVSFCPKCGRALYKRGD